LLSNTLLHRVTLSPATVVVSRRESSVTKTV
jgi:hypothetical protein